MAIPRTTVVDMTSHLRDYLGSNVNNEAQRVIIRGIQAALRELTNVRPWSYLYKRHRIHTNAPYSTGTVAFDYTGGSVEREFILSSGTWPTWAGNGTIAISNVTYEVFRRVSDTIVQADSIVTPVADIASGTSYTLYQDTYTMPADFVASDRFYAEISWGGMEYVQPNQWLAVTRYYRSSSNTPRYYTFMGSPRESGLFCMRIFPYPDSAATLDGIYLRRPRQIKMDQYSTGTATSSAGSTTVTGSGTAWTSAMEGSVIRLSSNATNLPTDLAGSNPHVVERTIKLVSSATQLTVEESIDTTYSAVKYQISDPIDIDDGAMLEAFYRCCEKHVATMRRLRDADEVSGRYQEALIRAEEADSRSFAGRVAGEGYLGRQRLANMPITFAGES